MRNYFLVPGGVIVWAGLHMISSVGPVYTNLAAIGVILFGGWIGLYRWKTLPTSWGVTRKGLFQSSLLALTTSGVLLQVEAGRPDTGIYFALVMAGCYSGARKIKQQTPWDQYPKL